MGHDEILINLNSSTKHLLRLTSQALGKDQSHVTMA
jgi:hypothetical protein